MSTDIARLRAVAETENFSGAVRVVSGDGEVVEFAAGFADRANQRPNTMQTRFSVASATKGFTALTIMSLVEDGALSMDDSIHGLVGEVLSEIDPAVTIDHLLTHRSGIGDYVDEEVIDDIDDHVIGELSAHTLLLPSDYAGLLNAHPQRTAPDVEFVYNNSGFVALAIVIEAVTGSFHQAVQDRVLTPAGMTRSGFFRSDDLPPDTALGYLVDGRTNVFHLPVIGSGDGGIYLSVDDVSSFWTALLAGEIVPVESVQHMTTASSHRGEKPSYGRGFWLADATAQHVWIEGMDAGVSFQSGVDRTSTMTYTVVSNTSSGTWPMVAAVLES